MKHIDKFIATNICPLFLIVLTIGCFYFSYYDAETPLTRGLSILLSLTLLVFNLRVASKLYQRKRIYDILSSRIEKNGYSKEIFEGKCPTICSLSLCIYLLIRNNQFQDINYLFRQFLSKKTLAIHPDLEIEKAINLAVFVNDQ